MLARACILLAMNTLARDNQKLVLSALVEGNSMRATARLTGVARNTIAALLRDIGAHCKNHHDRFVRGVAAKRVQCDEAWSFCAKKEKRASAEDRAEGKGDAWTWAAIDQDSKLVIAYRVGSRSTDMAHAFMHDLKGRLTNRIQLTTDAWRQYTTAVESAFGWNGCDYGQLVKEYGVPADADKRYSPAECIGVEKMVVFGKPKVEDVCTSHVERLHLTTRMQSRRYTRLTNAFSKKLEFHLYATALHFAFYNWCRPHMSLSKKAGKPTTPAMAANLTDRVWGMDDLLDLLLGN